MPGKPRVAIVQDALPFIGGAERVLESALELFPGSPVYTLVYRPEQFKGSRIASHDIHTSFINRLPAAKHSHRRYLPLYPLAVEQFDLRKFDLVLSFSYAAAHGILTRPDQLHISYTYTPMRQAWHHYQDYLEDSRLDHKLTGWAARAILHYFRLWDQAAAARVDQFVACSRWVARGIWRAYRRAAEVIYPPVEVQHYQYNLPREDYFLVVARLEPHKRVDLIVEAFAQLGLPLVVVGDGREKNRIGKLVNGNIKLLGRQPDHVVADLMSRARAFVMAAEEDFGISALEAQAAGCPVIAYGSGGALETVMDGETGLHYSEQTVSCLVQTVQEFERKRIRFDVLKLRQNAEQYSSQRFQEALFGSVMDAWEQFRGVEDEIPVRQRY